MHLHPLDEFPVHQTAAPLLQPVSGDPNHYDRYFFHGYDVDAGVIFVVALGLYPTREIIDAAFCVSHDGVQRSVFASGRASRDRATRVGPIAVDIVEPLAMLRVTVEAPDQQLGAELTFRARSAPLLEPRQTMQDRARVVMDTCRYTQFGRWSGTLHSGDLHVAVTPEAYAGTRDRSWGVRPLAATIPSAPAPDLPGIWWLWAPIQLRDRCLHVAVSEDPKGARTLQGASILPDVGDADTADDVPIEQAAGPDYTLVWAPGTRRAGRVDLTVTRFGRDPLAVHLEPAVRVHMRGAGYTHPEWGHGTWHGEQAVGGEVLAHDRVDPTDFSALHVQQACRVTVGDEEGVGMLEQLCIGPHEPTGLTGVVDPAR